MPICTENRFHFLHCGWLNKIPILYQVIIQFQDPHTLVTRHIYIYVNKTIYLWGTDGNLLIHFWDYEKFKAYLQG